LEKEISAFYGAGINIYNIDKNYTSLHAEVHAVQNLNFTKKKTKVNLFVFRTNKTVSNLMMAKTCLKCINYINKNLTYKGYKLHRIYYTNEEGSIVTMAN